MGDWLGPACGARGCASECLGILYELRRLSLPSPGTMAVVLDLLPSRLTLDEVD